MSRSPRVTRNSVTRPFIKCFAFPQEHDIPLNEIRIECLHDTKNNIPKGGGRTLSTRRWEIIGTGRVNVQNYTSPHDRLGFFKINLPAIQPRSESDKDGGPA